MLAYRDGELERTWIRVDWEVGEEGVEGMLRRCVGFSLSIKGALKADMSKGGDIAVTRKTGAGDTERDGRI